MRTGPVVCRFCALGQHLACTGSTPSSGPKKGMKKAKDRRREPSTFAFQAKEGV